MNNRGEINVAGLIIVVAITLIVGLIFFQAIAQQVGKSTNTVELVNVSLSEVAVNGTPQYLTAYKSLSNVVILNATDTTGNFTTNRTLVPAANYTITNNVIYNGALAVEIMPNATAPFKLGVWLVSGTGEPLDYISDSGGRAMANLIVIMFALAVLVVALTPTLRNGLVDMLTQ